MNPSHFFASRIIERARKSSWVVSGPFKGAIATESATIYDWNKLMGVYEFYLHPYIDAVNKANPPVCIDVGAAQGYYTLGLAYRLPNSLHIAYEMDDGERKKLLSAMSGLDLGQKIEIRGECTLNSLKRDVLSSETGFLLMDCEGAEKDLLTEAVHDALSQWIILLEVHDFHAPGAGETIIEIFKESHDISLCWSRDPSPSDLVQCVPFPLNFLCLDAFKDMFNEKRGGEMRFLYLTPKIRA